MIGTGDLRIENQRAYGQQHHACISPVPRRLDIQCSSASPRRRPAEEAETDVDERSSATDRRGTGERRRYNRRSVGDVSPPYYDVFERIALALEGIGDQLGGRRTNPQPPAPRSGSREGP